MAGLNKMQLEGKEVKMVSWEKYKVKDEAKLHDKLPSIVAKNFYDPEYFIWRNFLYRYLQSHIDSEATNKYTLTVKHKDRKSKDLYNETTATIVATLKAMQIECTPIFENITIEDIGELKDVLKMILSNASRLGKQLESDKVFTDIMYTMLASDELAVHYAAFRTYILRKRTLGHYDAKLEPAILDKINEWSRKMLTAFDELSEIIGDDTTVFEFYTEPIRDILVRLTDAFSNYLSGNLTAVPPVSQIYQNSLANCNELTVEFISDIVRNSPLYAPASYDPVTIYNLLYLFYKDDDSLVDTCILFAIGDRLYKKGMDKLDDIYQFLVTTNLGEACIQMMAVYLSNLHFDQQVHISKMNSYLYDLNDRGFIDYQTLEGKLL